MGVKPTFNCGPKYVGEFRNGEKSGRGIYFYTNGDSWEGGFINDQMHGKGIYTRRNGKVKIAHYNANQWVKWVDIDTSTVKNSGQQIFMRRQEGKEEKVEKEFKCNHNHHEDKDK